MNTNFENSMVEYKQPINVTTIYILAIAGILLSFCCSPIGIILAIIAVVMSANKMNAYKLNPSLFVGVEQLKTAQIVAYISLGINILLTIYFVYSLATGGLEQMMEAIEEGMRQAESYD